MILIIAADEEDDAMYAVRYLQASCGIKMLASLNPEDEYLYSTKATQTWVTLYSPDIETDHYAQGLIWSGAKLLIIKRANSTRLYSNTDAQVVVNSGTADELDSALLSAIINIGEQIGYIPRQALKHA